MIVHKDDGGGRLSHCRDKGFPRVHQTERQASLRDGDILDDRILAVEQNDLEDFAAQTPHQWAIVTKNILARTDASPGCQRSRNGPLADFQRGLDRGSLCRSNAGNRAKLSDPLLVQSVQPSVLIEDSHSKIEGRIAGMTPSQHYGQELAVG